MMRQMTQKLGTNAMTTHPDLVIRRGTIADGLGGELFEADVAITGGRITEVGKVAGNGKEEIDAKGKLVAPGFVDVHTHYDGQVTWSQDITPSSQNGVTSRPASRATISG
jgi:N-acyl-D-aspartate/D-glutamate deacylase